jgi:hypothetical protein
VAEVADLLHAKINISEGEIPQVGNMPCQVIKNVSVMPYVLPIGRIKPVPHGNLV